MKRRALTLFVQSFTPSLPFLEKRFLPPVCCVVGVAARAAGVGVVVLSSSDSFCFLLPVLLPLERRLVVAFIRFFVVPSEP